MEFFTTGNQTVDQIGKISITGDVIPVIWYETVLNDRGKPAYLSIMILADIMYWYKPIEVRDERTGRVIGWRKRFDGPMLQRDYKHWAAKYGESEKTIKRAIEILLTIQVVIKHNEIVEMDNGLIRNNVLYWEIVPEKVFQLTYPEREAVKDIPVSGAYTRYRILTDKEKEEYSYRSTFSDKDVGERSPGTNVSGGIGQMCPEGVDNTVRRPKTKLVTASGQNCTESWDNGGKGVNNIKPNGDRKVVYPSIHQSVSLSTSEPMELLEEKVDYRSVIASNINLEKLLENAHNTKTCGLVEDTYEVICEVMGTSQDSIKINTIEQPTEYVRNRFMRLKDHHVMNVVGRVLSEKTCIGNMKSYLLTSVYNESFNR